MYDAATRYGGYKRGTYFFTIYSAILFFFTPAVFLQLKTILYFFVGYAVSGAVAVLFMSWQYKIETRLNQNFWFLNILIDVVGYFVFTYLLFYLFF